MNPAPFRRIAWSRPALLVLGLAVVAGFGAAAAPARAADEVFTVDPAKSAVTFLLTATGHDVEGIMAAPTGAIRFDPATGHASGQIRLDLRPTKTGNKSRDKTMHEDVLESAKYPEAVLTATKLVGSPAPSGTANVTLEGRLSIHGADHEVRLPAKVTVDAGRLAVETALDVPFVAWGMEDPSFFIFRTAKVVKVTIRAEGSLAAAPAAAH